MYKADLWRICKLYKNTGIYADVDLIPHIKLDDINKNINFYTVISADNTHLFQAFIINNCKPRHPLFLVFIISFFINKAWTRAPPGPCHDMYNCVKYILGEEKLNPHCKYKAIEQFLLNIGGFFHLMWANHLS